ncbi:MAG: 50S ribosomal protein L24 [Defluviitaleaceae bacterium]|nr:50S ribosomal protein L24 [Defluviitaleaceae bacterium]
MLKGKPTEPTKIRLKKGDRVRIIAGKDKGKEGKVLFIDRVKNRVIVEGANMISKHMKPSRTNQKGGIINKEAPLNASNVMYLHNGKPTRLGVKVTATETNGVKTIVKSRIARSTGEVID